MHSTDTKCLESIHSNPEQHFQQAFNWLWIPLLQRSFKVITLCKGKAREIKKVQFFRSFCVNLKPGCKQQSLHTIPRLTIVSLRTPSWWNIWKFWIKWNGRQVQILVLDVTQPEFSASFSRWYQKLFNNALMIFLFIILRNNSITEKSKSSKTSTLYIRHTDNMYGRMQCSFSSMNDVFISIRNLLSLETVSNLILLRGNRPPAQHFTHKNLSRLDWKWKKLRWCYINYIVPY